jgi:hypothetical protein
MDADLCPSMTILSNYIQQNQKRDKQTNNKSAERSERRSQKYNSRMTKSIRGTTSQLRYSQTLLFEYDYENAVRRNTYWFLILPEPYL